MLKKLIVTGLGTGLLPMAPGTWGSAGMTLVYVLAALTLSAPATWALMLAFVLAASVGCVALGPFAEAAFGKKDPGQVTIDEWAGQALTFLLVPLRAGLTGTLVVAGIGFVAFRVFDIVKPPPANGLQRLRAGWGILVDDLIAGIYANIVLQLALLFVYK